MRTLLLAATIAGAAGCLTEPDNDVIQWSDDFEACDDLCGWTFAGQAERVTTYHPGEHALRLAPGARASHALAISRRAGNGGNPNWNDSDGNWIELSTDCIGPGALEVRRADPSGSPVRYWIELALDDRGLGGFTRHRINLPPLADVELSFAGIDLETGALPCVIDNVQARISGGELGY